MRENIHLEYTLGNSSKFWEAEVDGTRFTARWGKIGTAGQEKTWTHPTSSAAYEAYEAKVNEKLNKGYEETGSARRHKPAPPAPVGPPTLSRPSRVAALLADDDDPAPASSNGSAAPQPPKLRPMLAEEDDQTKLIEYAEKDDWFFEQKLDGHRVLLEVVNGRAYATGRNGQSSQHSALFMQKAYATELARLDTCVLDGELVDQTFWIFDLPWNGGDVEPKTPYTERRDALDTIMAAWNPDPACFRLLPTAKDRRTKTELAMECLRQGGEGVMAKKVDGIYQPSVRSRQVVKLKFVKEGDFVVTEVGWKGKDNYVLGLYRDGVLIDKDPIGRCSAIGKEKCDVGDVVLVRYLYIGADGKLYQPRMMRKRTDKAPEECTYDQVANHGVNKKVFA